MKSIRRRVTTTLGLGLGGLLAGLNGVVWLVGMRTLGEAFDSRLEERARSLATLIVQTGPLVELEFADPLMPSYSRAESPDYFQVFIQGEGGGIVERSESLGLANLPRPSHDDGPTRFLDLDLPDGRPGRAAQFVSLIHEYEPIDWEGRTASQRTTGVTVAIDRTPLAAARHQLALWLLAVDAFFLLGSGLIVWATLRRGLAPIEAFSARIREIERPDQAPELSRLGAPAELQPIAQSIDRMLQRLEDAFARERRLSGNIAHELRTPIAELRLGAEVALGDPSDAAGLHRAVNEARDIAIEMDRTISTLLRLWRHEQAREQALGTVELGAVLDAAVRGAALLATERSVGMTCPFAVRCEVAVAERPLALVISNLMQNAASHARPGTEVQGRVTVALDMAEFVLENDSDDDLDESRVFEPFYSTKRGAAHAGLGLPLSRALCEASGMELDVTSSGGRFIARLRMPLVAAA